MTAATRRRDLGKVEEIRVGPEDHGIFTFIVRIDFGSAGQGFGGYALDTYDKDKKRRVGTAAGMDLLLRLYRFFGVDDLNRAIGVHVWVLYDEPGFAAPIVGLQRTEPEGGAELLIDEWRKEWFDD